MKILGNVTDNMEVWAVEVYRTERPVGYSESEGVFVYEGGRKFWDDEMYVTIEKAVFVVNTEHAIFEVEDAMDMYYEKYKTQTGCTVSVTRLDENLNYNGCKKIK